MALSRRGFLKFAGKTAAVSATFLSGCAQTSMQSAARSAGGPTRAIDIHHHYFPPELIDEIKQHGKALGGIEYFPPKQAKDNPYQIQFPKGRRFAPDRRMAEVPNRLDAMTKGNVGIAMVEVHTAHRDRTVTRPASCGASTRACDPRSQDVRCDHRLERGRQILQQQRLRSVLEESRGARRSYDHAPGMGRRRRQDGTLQPTQHLR